MANHRKRLPPPKRFTKTPLDIAIGARIRAYRIARKISQEELGEALGVTFQQVQKYEKGANRISGSRLVKLCEVLQVRAEQILGNDSGVFDEQPDVLTVLQDRSSARMLAQLQALPRHQRSAVLEAISIMVKAFRNGKPG
jgi:transcriptional regulator with XRE-family HTH domain